MLIFFIVGILLGAVTIVFALQNITTITVVFMNWQFEGSLALILMLAVVVGILISTLMSLPDSIRKGFQISRLRKHNAKLQDELVNKKVEVEVEKTKLATTNAFIDDLGSNPRV